MKEIIINESGIEVRDGELKVKASEIASVKFIF